LQESAGGFGLQKKHERGILNIESDRPQGGLPFSKLEEPPHRTGKVLGRFSYVVLLIILENKCKQCQYEQTKGHKILE
jgi:hypothetical protein